MNIADIEKRLSPDDNYSQYGIAGAIIVKDGKIKYIALIPDNDDNKYIIYENDNIIGKFKSYRYGYEYLLGLLSIIVQQSKNIYRIEHAGTILCNFSCLPDYLEERNLKNQKIQKHEYINLE